MTSHMKAKKRERTYERRSK